MKLGGFKKFKSDQEMLNGSESNMKKLVQEHILKGNYSN